METVSVWKQYSPLTPSLPQTYTHRVSTLQWHSEDLHLSLSFLHQWLHYAAHTSNSSASPHSVKEDETWTPGETNMSDPLTFTKTQLPEVTGRPLLKGINLCHCMDMKKGFLALGSGFSRDRGMSFDFSLDGKSVLSFLPSKGRTIYHLCT